MKRVWIYLDSRSAFKYIDYLILLLKVHIYVKHVQLTYLFLNITCEWSFICMHKQYMKTKRSTCRLLDNQISSHIQYPIIDLWLSMDPTKSVLTYLSILTLSCLIQRSFSWVLLKISKDSSNSLEMHMNIGMNWLTTFTV